MKIVLILGSLLVAYVAAEGKECPLMQKMKEGLETCVQELECSEETINNLKEDKGPADRNTNCLRACLMEKAELMDNTKVKLEKLEELLKSSDGVDMERVDAMMTVMKDCRDAGAEKTTDKCDTAANYTKCVNDAKAAGKIA